MRKVFPIFAVLMAMTLAIWMVGCGEEDVLCEITVTLASTAPADGGDINSNGSLTITFEGSPDANSVTVNGNAAAGAGTKYTWAATGLTEGQQATITIAWKYCGDTDEPKDGEATITLNVIQPDPDPPEIASSEPADGAKDLDPEALNSDGVTVTFNEPVTVKSGNVYFEAGDEKISWLVEQSDDKTELMLTVKGGAELGFETEYTLKMDGVTDLAGNEADLSITFTTQAKEE
jgi:hypothetical protein